MRTFIYMFILCFFLSCAGNGITNNTEVGQLYEPGRIYGTVAELPGRKILLYGLYGEDVNLLDSVIAGRDGSFEFIFPEERSRGLYRIAMGKNTLPGHYDLHSQRFDLIWDGSTVAFRTHYATPVDSMEIILSEENILYYRFLRRMRNFDQKVRVLNNALLHYPEDDNFYRRLERQHRRVQNRRSNFIDNLIKKNSNTVFSSIARFQKLPGMSSPGSIEGREEFKKKFFIDGQFADSVLLFTDLIPRKIINYLSLYSDHQLDEEEQQEEYILAVDVIMQHAMENEAVFYFLLEYLINGFDSMEDMGPVTEHLKKRYLFGDICFEEGMLLDQADLAAVEELEEGDRVPGFSFEALDSRIIDLYEIDAEYTIIFFWGSWCIYCEDIIDDLYEMYLDFRSRQEGFLEVVAIGIEDDEQMWLDYIETGGYEWINYSSLKSWDCPISRSFNLRGTPTMILLDREKRFIQEPVRIRALNRYLSRRL